MTKRVTKKTVTETIDEDGSKKTVVKEHIPKIIDNSEHHKSQSSKTKKSTKKKMTAREREELLIENFVGLQHAMTNMSIKFGSLSDNISKLLQIFEEAAKNFASGGKPDDKDMLNKIDSLLDQNKTIAKGLVLMEGKLRGRAEETQMTQSRPEASHIRPKPLPSI
ncbi:MAG: hypothetical protein OEL87_03180 [Nanoarchaeota archaeon]|nr:hypothetical protein [Nanoarchaeota archaeon]